MKFFQPSSLRLNRFDLFYDSNKTDSFNFEEFDQFLLDSCKYILDFTRIRKVKVTNNNSKRFISGINDRFNTGYFRVYETLSTIRFELELNKSTLDYV